MRRLKIGVTLASLLCSSPLYSDTLLYEDFAAYPPGTDLYDLPQWDNDEGFILTDGYKIPSSSSGDNKQVCTLIELLQGKTYTFSYRVWGKDSSGSGILFTHSRYYHQQGWRMEDSSCSDDDFRGWVFDMELLCGQGAKEYFPIGIERFIIIRIFFDLETNEVWGRIEDGSDSYETTHYPIIEELPFHWCIRQHATQCTEGLEIYWLKFEEGIVDAPKEESPVPDTEQPASIAVSNEGGSGGSGGCFINSLF